QPAEEVCFTGQDFAPFLESLAKKKVKCTFIFDCCHSGQLYRVTEFEASGLRPKQVIFKKAEVSASKTKQSEYTKAHRGGWTPEDDDHFVYIAACTTVQVAAEEIGKGGRLTMAIENVINSLSAPDNVSYEAFFRLISKEFKKRGWDQRQTPQIEGANRDTVLFGTSKVIPLAGGILVKDVPSKEEVVLDAGYLQSLSIGEYNVFETTASEDSVKQGTKSKDLLASIDINEGNIETAQAFGSVVCRQEGKEITHGCLAYLKTPGSIKTNVFIADQVPKHSDDLLQQLKGTNMLNVLPQTPSTQDPDLTTITKEEIKDKMCWVARRRGNVIVPPVSLGREEVMASNLCRHSRFQIALERAKSPTDREEVLGNVSLKVSKLEKVQPYRSKRSKIQRTQEALKGTDISAVRDQRPSFQAHSVIEGTTRLQDRTGDAFAFEVTNHNAKPEDTVHICILFYQFDGRIAALYPKKTGRTIELRGGDTAEDIFKLYIPEGSLRTMAEPDPSKVEPNMGIDTLVLYAASGSVDFGPIVQSAIETDPDILDRGDVDTVSHYDSLSVCLCQSICLCVCLSVSVGWIL
ncbi:hypothetical protein QZH41_016658, partial [Actinostola sp. cb2023]